MVLDQFIQGSFSAKNIAPKKINSPENSK